MNDNPKWQVARLDDIERHGRAIPVREHLGIRAFGISAFTPGDDGTLINEHDESGSGQEELYIVLDGNATFEVDGYACFATLAGDTGNETFGHLRRSVELFPPFREQARRDDDFAAVRDDPRFEEALR